MDKHIVVFNAGSSSVRFKLYAVSEGALQARLSGAAMGIGTDLQIRSTDGGLQKDARAFSGVKSHAEVLAFLIDWLERQFDMQSLCGVGHRVVHGGGVYHDPVRIDDAVLQDLESFAPLAPHHLPHSVAAMRMVQQHMPHAPQVACFDTGFHHDMPQEGREVGLPRDYRAKGYRRYGFHGASYAYITGAFERITGEALPPRTVIAHLGNGASLCAVQNGRSIATTMGYSTLDGLVMGTRSGALDPGVVLALMRQDNMTPDDVEDLLYNRSGLLGLSGVSADMRTLLASADPAAREAMGFWAYRITREVGSLAAALGGLDALIFTGGIGENAKDLRADILARLAWMGFDVDEKANRMNEHRLTHAGSARSAWAVPTDEEGYIAAATRDELGCA